MSKIVAKSEIAIIQVEDGTDGQSSYLYTAWANNSTGSSGFSTTVSANKLYIGTYTDTNPVQSTTPSKYNWVKIKGEGVSSSAVHYVKSASGTVTPAANAGWSTSLPTPTSGQYLWTRVTLTFTDGSTNESYSVSYYSVGVERIDEYYKLSTSNVTPPTGTWDSTPSPTTTTNKYLWNYEVIVYSDGSSTPTSKRVISTHGATGATGAEGRAITGVTNYYLVDSKTTGITTSDSRWSTTPGVMTPTDKYLWNYEKISYSKAPLESTTTPTIIGAYGQQGIQGIPGQKGADGTSITSVDVEYAKNTSRTTAPTSGWTTSAPKWESGSYIWQRIKTTYSVGNPTYSEPHAIETDVANNLTEYVASRGLNLVTNGTGMLKDSTNFPGFTFDGSQAYASDGSFLYTGSATTQSISENIPVDPNLSYRFNYYIKGDVEEQPQPVRAYGFVQCLDTDGNTIFPSHTMYYSGTTTKLARDLNIGDTEIYLEDSSGWGTSELTHQRSIIVWGYKNSYGYEYPTETYSRYWVQNAWENASSIDKVNHVITLKSPWSIGNFPKGREVSNGNSGSSFKYIAGSNYPIEVNWASYNGTISGIDTTGTNIQGRFHPGTASVKIGWLLNRYANISTWISNVSFMLDNASQSDLNETKEQVKKTVKTITEEYYQSTSATSQVGGSWTTTAPTWDANKFMFVRSKITYVDGTSSYTPTVNLSGAKGDKGDKGDQGIQGPKGNDGTSQYVYIRYSVNSNGNPMTPSPQATTKYIGIANTTSSTAPTGYASYTWSKYVGEDGSQGPQGIQGPAGANGQPTYTWVKYADTPTSGMSDYPDGKKYIGLAFNKTTETESTDYSDYQWSLMPQNITVGGRNYLLNSGERVYFEEQDVIPTTVGRYLPIEGGRNLVLDSNQNNPIPLNWTAYSTSRNKKGTLSGRECQIMTPGIGITNAPRQSFLGKLEANTTYTFSCWYYVDDLEYGTTNPYFAVYIDGYRNVEGVSTWFGVLSYNLRSIPFKEWVYVSTKFTTPSFLGEATRLDFYSIFSRDMTGVIGHYNIKLEKGDTPTDWTPAPEDFNDLKGKSYDLSQPLRNENILSLNGSFEEDDFIGLWLGSDKFVGFLDNQELTFDLTENYDDEFVVVKTLSEKGIINNAKLEKGNTLTDWTPAPEDVQNEITRVETETTAKITTNSEAITLEKSERETQYGTLEDTVKTQYATISLVDNAITNEVTAREELGGALQEEISSQVQQTVDSFNVIFNKIEADQNLTNDEVALIQSYFRINENGVIIGKTDSAIEFFAENNRVGFRENGNDIAYWEEGTMHVDRLIAVTTIMVGYHLIEKYDSPVAGNTTIVRIGD